MPRHDSHLPESQEQIHYSCTNSQTEFLFLKSKSNKKFLAYQRYHDDDVRNDRYDRLFHNLVAIHIGRQYSFFLSVPRVDIAEEDLRLRVAYACSVVDGLLQWVSHIGSSVDDLPLRVSDVSFAVDDLSLRVFDVGFAVDNYL